MPTCHCADPQPCIPIQYLRACRWTSVTAAPDPQWASCSQRIPGCFLGASSLLQGGCNVCHRWAKGRSIGAGIIIRGWPAHRRRETCMLILALPLAHAEFRAAFPLAEPQFASCKMGRSQQSRVGLRRACGRWKERTREGPSLPGLAPTPAPHVPPGCSSPPHRGGGDRPRLAGAPGCGSPVACTAKRLLWGL